MRVALTGASGLIGRRVAAQLREEGHILRLLSRHPARDVQGLSSRDEVVVWDAERPPAPGLLQGCEAVIHLAGEPVAQRWTRHVKERIRDMRDGALNDGRFFARMTGTGRYWDSVKQLFEIHRQRLGLTGPHRASGRPAAQREPPTPQHVQLTLDFDARTTSAAFPVPL